MSILTRTDIERDIRAFLVSNFLYGRADALSNNAVLLGSIIDSTGAVELVMFLQDKFGITVEDEEIAVPENFDSLPNVVTFVETKLRNSAPAGNFNDGIPNVRP